MQKIATVYIERTSTEPSIFNVILEQDEKNDVIGRVTYLEGETIFETTPLMKNNGFLLSVGFPALP